MNALERHQAKVYIRKLEKEGKLSDAYELAQKSAEKCWQRLDNHNYKVFERIAENIRFKIVDQE